MRALITSAVSAALALSLSPAFAQQANDSNPPDRVSTQAGEMTIEEVAELEFPWGIAELPDGRLLITEKPGRMRIWDEGNLSEPLGGLPEVVYRGEGDQGGLMDVALHPDFDNNQLVYFSYVEAAEAQPEDLQDTGDARFGNYLDVEDHMVRGGVVARGRLQDNQLQDVEVIWEQQPKTIGRGHFGNRIVFASDGKLFITSGDRMRFEPAQDIESNLGKVVRINDDGSTPNDNPFAGQEEGRDDVFSYGHRNILAAAVEPESGELWTFEMGPLGGDEVNRIEAGANYGWPEVSDGSHYGRQTIPAHPGAEDYTQPVRTWTPVVSPSGATFLDDSAVEEWDGSLLVGGLSSQALVRLELGEDQVEVEERIDVQRRIRDVIETADGSIYLLEDAADGSLLRMTPAG